VGPPVGPTGAALSCAGEPEAPESPDWHIALSTTWSATDVVFSGNLAAKLRRRSASASVEYRASDDWTVNGGGGLSFSGDMTVDGETYDLEPGPLVLVGGAYRILDGDGWEPFLLAGTQFSTSSVKTRSRRDDSLARMTALDLRFSLTFGEVFLGAIAPYATVRGFGGPIIWKGGQTDTSGSDRYHFQLGGGMLVTAGWLDAYFEVIPLGERAASVGVGTAF